MDANQTPKTFARYHIIKELGRGGMGCVYQAYDPNLNRHLALKVLLGGEFAREEETQRFLREAKTTAKLHHPHIITLHDIGREGNQYFFTMDFIMGKPWSDLLEDLSLAQNLEILAKVAKALHYAHQQGVIHRDLKPQNIMVLEDYTPKVMDFGLAKLDSASMQLSKTGMVMGSFHYMSPEQANGDTKGIDTRSDIYALGVILYQILTKKLPLNASSSIEMIEAILNDMPVAPLEINPDLPAYLQDVCLKALAKKKKNRHSSAKEFGNELIAPKKSARRARKKARKSKKPLKLVFALATIVLVVVLFVLTQKNKNNNKASVDFKGKALYWVLPSQFNEGTKINVPAKLGQLPLEVLFAPSFSIQEVRINGKKINFDKNKFSTKLPILYGKNEIQLLVLSQDKPPLRKFFEVTREKALTSQIAMNRGGERHLGVYSSRGIYKLKGLKWKFLTGARIRRPPIVIGGIVYSGSEDKNIYALDAYNGKLKWKFATAGAIGTPAVFANTVYCCSSDKHVYALDVNTGKFKWKFKADASMWTSPTVYKGIVYFRTDNGTFYAIDAHSGQKKWTFATSRKDPWIRISPSIGANKVFCGGPDGIIYALYLKNGKLRWKYNAKSRIVSYIPVADKNIYFGTKNKYLYAVRTRYGKLLWKFLAKASVNGSPVVLSNNIYFGAGRVLYAVTVKKGERIWEYSHKANISCSPIIAEKVLYFGDQKGDFCAVDIDKGKLLWKYSTGRIILGGPVSADGIVYFANDQGYIYALW